MIGASIVNIRTLYRCMDDGKDSFPTALFVAKKQFPMTMELFMEAIFLLTIAPTVELKWMVMRLIDADNTNLRDTIGRNAFRDRQDIIDLINDQPTVDAVVVVRCKDCKYHDEGERYIYCWALKTKCPNDSEFFCKYGELEG